MIQKERKGFRANRAWFMKCKAVVFDMDGVIFDSERLVLEGWIMIAEKYGFADIEEVYYRCVGVNSTLTKEIFLKHYGADFPYDTYKNECSALFHSRYDGGRLPMKSGVTDLLSYLKEEKYLIGLASSTRQAVVTQEIKDAGLMEYFDNLTCGDMVKKSKPEPDIFLQACESLGVLPEEVITIEDSYNGIRAAYRAGTIPVMVPDMIQPDEEMKRLSCRICKDLLEVREWFSDAVYNSRLL